MEPEDQPQAKPIDDDMPPADKSPARNPLDTETSPVEKPPKEPESDMEPAEAAKPVTVAEIKPETDRPVDQKPEADSPMEASQEESKSEPVGPKDDEWECDKCSTINSMNRDIFYKCITCDT